jgi:predicted DNA-binding mobile mystery protein A
MRRDISRRARASLDARLTPLGPAQRYRAPQSGWIRAIRDALGMSAADLGRRMKITGPAVSALERSERDGTAGLNTLRRAAEAMDCTLVYVFIPNRGLEETVRRQANKAARGHLVHVKTTMALEDQAVNVDEGLVQAQADLLIQTGRIWHDQP